MTTELTVTPSFNPTLNPLETDPGDHPSSLHPQNTFQPHIDQSIELSPCQDVSEPPYSLSKVRIIGRICTLVIVIAALMFGRNSVPDNEIECAEDKLQNVLEIINQTLQLPQYNTLTKFLIASCSILSDGVFIGTFLYWILYGKSLRLPISLGFFTIVRLVCLYVWHSPIPVGYLWERPEIPSLVVTFEAEDGFFYCKYLGYLVICSQEWGEQGKRWVKYMIMGACVYLVCLSLILRANYTIDLFTGVVFGIWFYERVGWYVENVDRTWRKWTDKVDKVLVKRV